MFLPTEGYLKTYTETDPVFSSHVAHNITDAGSFEIIKATERAKLNNAITSYTETDPEVGIMPTNNVPK